MTFIKTTDNVNYNIDHGKGFEYEEDYESRNHEY